MRPFTQAPMTVPLAIALMAATPATAQPRFDNPFGTGMVLQHGREIPLHGTAAAGARVAVTFDGQTTSTQADPSGHWQARLPAHAPGGPFDLTANDGTGQSVLGDVLVGDVWLCSGQSNMEFTLRHATNADTEVAQSDHPQLRLYNVPHLSSPTPAAHPAVQANWERSSPASSADFSAACYFMGRDLAAHQNIPIGLISASWGGSVIEDWLSRPALETVERYRARLALLDRYGRDPGGAHAEWGEQLAHWLGGRLAPARGAVWRPVPKITFWEEWGGDMAFFDGIGYYRAHVALTPAQATTGEIVIGSVDDMDVTRLNGRMIGADQGWNTERHYNVPKGLLHAGDNVIDVTAIDTGGGGGIWGTPPYLKLADGSRLPLSDLTFSRGAAIAETGLPQQMPWIGGSGVTTLFNGMIAPLNDYPMAGVAWYQGEANVSDPQGYAELLPLLARDWRGRMGVGPFIMVQLANFGPLSTQPVDDSWGRFRDAQRRIADADPQIGLASATDIGQSGNIHPTNKQDVGARLALEARRLWLKEPTSGRGPSPVDVVATADGIRVRFAGGPMKLVGAGQAIGFELCNSRDLCRFAEGALAADGNSILLPADPAATEVRYLWQASPLINLYNRQDLPATPFALTVKR